jgi:hypothetical protein
MIGTHATLIGRSVAHMSATLWHNADDPEEPWRLVLVREGEAKDDFVGLNIFFDNEEEARAAFDRAARGFRSVEITEEVTS